jgi:2-dehydropantoate 2-reductase
MAEIDVVGAGGIGCAVGYDLLRRGHRVRFVEVNERKIDEGRRFGVAWNDEPAMTTEFVHFRDWQPGPKATVILATKCYDNATVLAKLPRTVQLIPIQNGFDSALESRDHTHEGIASFVAHCPPDRPHARITRPGQLHLGPRVTTAAASIAELWPRTSLLNIVHVSDVRPIKNTKLMYNAAISPIAAAAGLDNGELLTIPAARRLFFDLLAENYAILRAASQPLGKVGPFHPRTVSWILRRRWLANTMAGSFAKSLRGTYCSMAGEIATGRTELEHYTGHLMRLAAGVIDAPLNRRVYEIVSGMVRERAAPRRDVIDALILKTASDNAS